jgi:hypothetical protein
MAFDEVTKDRYGRVLPHPAAMAMDGDHRVRTARDQQVDGNGTLPAETIYECVVALMRKVDPFEAADLRGAPRVLAITGDAYLPSPLSDVPASGGATAPQPPPVTAQDSAYRRRTPTSSELASYYSMFPETRRI